MTPCVSHLFCSGSPSTVGWFVVPIVVDPLNGESSGAFPHVSIEVLKLKPTLTDLYPATTVIPISLAVGIVASLEDCVPHLEQWSFTSPVDRVATVVAWFATNNVSACNLRQRGRPFLFTSWANHQSHSSSASPVWSWLCFNLPHQHSSTLEFVSGWVDPLFRHNGIPVTVMFRSPVCAITQRGFASSTTCQPQIKSSLGGYMRDPNRAGMISIKQQQQP